MKLHERDGNQARPFSPELQVTPSCVPGLVPVAAALAGYTKLWLNRLLYGCMCQIGDRSEAVAAQRRGGL